MRTIDVFRQGFDFEGPVDVAYFEKIPGASAARDALAFMNNPLNEFELHKRNGEEDVTRMWKATLRACITYGVPLPSKLRGFALRLGIPV